MDPDSTLASYLRTVCPDADLSGSAPRRSPSRPRRRGRRAAPEIATAVAAELAADQRANLKLIASENFASPATLLAMGATGSRTSTPRARPGTASTPAARTSTPSRAGPSSWPRPGLFGSDHAYVQLYSGIDANLVAFWSILTRRVEAPALERLGAKDLQGLPDTDWESLRHELGNQRLLGMALDARPPDPRVPAERVREAVRDRPLHGRPDHRAARLRPGPQAGRELPAAGPAGRVQLLSAQDQLPRLPGDRRPGGGRAHGRHGPLAGLVTCKVFSGDFDLVAHAHVVTTTTYASGRGPRAEGAVHRGGSPPSIGSPAGPGAPPAAIMAAKAVARPRPPGRSSPTTPSGSSTTRPPWPADALQQQGATVVTGGTDNHLLLVDARPYGLTGRQAETALREAGITSTAT